MAGSSAAVVVAAPDPEISRLLGSGARNGRLAEATKCFSRREINVQWTHMRYRQIPPLISIG
jgi:hypothetical protein